MFPFKKFQDNLMEGSGSVFRWERKSEPPCLALGLRPTETGSEIKANRACFKDKS
jgi:hypothetical protein